MSRTSGFLVHPSPSACILSFRVGGRDQAKLGVEDVDQVVEVPGAVRHNRDASSNSWRDLICPLMSVPLSGSRAFSTAWAAFWWRRCSGGAVEAS